MAQEDGGKSQRVGADLALTITLLLLLALAVLLIANLIGAIHVLG
jgi:hypothetical protein